MDRTCHFLCYDTKPVSIETASFENLIQFSFDTYPRTSTPAPPSPILERSVDDFDEMIYDSFRGNLDKPPLHLRCRGLKGRLDDITGCHLIAIGDDQTKLCTSLFDLSRFESESKRNRFDKTKKFIRFCLTKLRKFITKECNYCKCKDLNCRCCMERSLIHQTEDDRFINVII